MMKRTNILLAFLLCSFFGAQGQSASFLNINPDVRSAGMGDGGVALGSNAFSLYLNPSATVFGDSKGAVAYSYLPWQRELTDGSNLHILSGYYRLGNKSGLLAGFRYFTHGDIVVTDGEGNTSGSFTPKEFSIDLGYAYRLCDRWSVSAVFHYISSDLGDFSGAKKGSAFAADLGAMYHAPSWNAGLSVTNLGSKIDYGYDSYELPASLKAGGAYWHTFSDRHRLTGHAELAYRLMPSDYSGVNVGLGAEYLYNDLIAVRGGYHIGDDKKTGPSYATLGCGLMYRGAEVNFAYWLAGSDSPVKGTFCLSAGWSF